MISEETLTLYYYNDGLSGHERRQVETALNDDALLSGFEVDLSELGELEIRKASRGRHPVN